jgi:hypothetical protein
MKQVMCINDCLWWSDKTDQLRYTPRYREVCTVLEEVEEDGIMGYKLLEYPDREPFIASQFIPFSNSSVEIAEEAMAGELVEA